MPWYLGWPLLLTLGNFVFFLINDFNAYDWFSTEKKLFFIVGPLFFFSLKQPYFLKSKKWKVTFTFSCFVLALLTAVVYVFFAFKHMVFSDQAVFEFRTTLEKVTGYHPTYLGLYLTIGILTYIEYIGWKVVSIRWIDNVVLIMLVIGVVLTGSRISLIPLIGILFYFIYQNQVLKKLLKQNWLWVIGGSMLIIPIIWVRIEELIHLFINYGEGMQYIDGTNQRVIIWSCLKELWIDKPFGGYGASNLAISLSMCYNLLEQPQMALEMFNTHNEFLNIGLSLSFPVLGIVIASIIVSMVKVKSLFFRIFISVICCYMLTENIFERQDGVIIFAIFFSILTVQYLKKFDA